MILDACESTNASLKKLGEDGAPHGSWISARMQTHGRGRMGRSWEAKPGNLFLSVLVRISDPIPLTWIPLQSGISVVDAVLQNTSVSSLKIKWPNDLVVVEGGVLKKVGGILCEGVGQKGSSFVVIGIGLNCKSHPNVDQPTTSLGIDVDQIRPKILEAILKPYEEGLLLPDLIRERFLKHSVLVSGAPLEWKDHMGQDHVGIFLELGPMGELRVEMGSEIKSLYSEEIKLKPIRLNQTV